MTEPAGHPSQADTPSLLRPDETVWRIGEAGRASLLVDAAAYYGALRSAMRQARHSIWVAGWDIDSRTPLVGPSGEPDDGLPAHLGPFLTALVTRRPELRVKLLLWDYSVLYAMERELLPALALHWNTPSQVELCLDDQAAFGASQHQKVVVIDGRVAFAGGLDLTIRRWDTPEHTPHNPHRVDPRGEPYPPFHDLQMVVDGAVARDLADLFRQRWAASACEDLSPLPADDGALLPWPEALTPDFRGVRMGIALTEGGYAGGTASQVERLFEAMIGTAERALYIENQFLTHLGLARRLAARLRERPELEVVILGPRTHHTWLEHRTMQVGRIRFMETLRQAGVADRVRLLHPRVEGRMGGGADIMVHSKLMIVDDRLLRVGSANLCHRSMGTDSECDLVIEARTANERQAIEAARARLLSEHLGAAPAAVAEAIRRHGLFGALDSLGSGRRRLLPIEDGPLREGESLSQIEAVADPPRPLGADTLLADFSRPGEIQGRRSLWFRIALAAAPVLLLGLAWRYTPLSGYLNPETFSASMQSASGAWGPAIALGLFLFLGLIAFPVNVLIVATAAAFGLWPGLAYAAIGAMFSALLTYLIGRWLGPGTLRRVFGPRINRVSQGIARNGILAVTLVRLMPVAPFTLVNLVAGAMRIRLLDYTVGTALGLAPGLILMTALGDRLLRILTDPSWRDLLGFALVLLAWGGLSYGLQIVIGWLRRRVAGKSAGAGSPA
ncbi:VTT domain-containing protein [Roseomonas sp. KE0001]|uniref:VTT domain-containing protein n=1 Tax=Roseomonas sp. KE0001 TaxID=2479201 RepID=UPI0018DFA4E4|nr:phospholipase [Roseomonas sp. KE0001]